MKKYYLAFVNEDGKVQRKEQFNDLASAYSYAQGYFEALVDFKAINGRGANPADIFTCVEKDMPVTAFWDKDGSAKVVISTNQSI